MADEQQVAAAGVEDLRLQAAQRLVWAEMIALDYFRKSHPDVTNDHLWKICGWLAKQNMQLSLHTMTLAWEAVR